MLFYNDEGTEDGGLVFNGKKTSADGVSSGLSLTFDRYDQDQQLQLIGTDQGGSAVAGMQVNDVPDRPMLQSIEEKAKLAAMPKDEYQALMKKRESEHYYGAPRYYAGKSGSDNSVVMLNDANGAPRLLLMVTKKGTASIEFLDANGKVQRTLSASEPASK